MSCSADGKLVTVGWQAYTAGDWGDPSDTAGDWGDPSDTATATCGGLDPSPPVPPEWLSPNGSGLIVTEPDPDNPGEVIQVVRHWANPELVRYMPDESKVPASGSDNCTVTQRNAENDGWTRTCTIYWSEIKEVRAHLAWHPSDAPHVHVASHAHRHDDNTGDYGHDGEHHHCTTEIAQSLLANPEYLPGFTGCPSGDPHGEHVDFDDGRGWADRVGSYAISGVISAGAAFVAAATAPLTAGQSVALWIAGLGATIGAGEALYRLTEDGKVILKMSGNRGCSPTAGWDQQTAPAADSPAIEYAETAASYTTITRHIIQYCEEAGSNS